MSESGDNMSYEERKTIYEEIRKERGNPLIIYVTSIRPNLSSQMAPDAIPFIIEQINNIPKVYKSIDFMIISNGGDVITAQRIHSLLRERFEKINIIIPYVAYSAATIFTLGADNIIMGQYSNLGPVDPQITSRKKDGNGEFSNIQFGSEDLRYFIEFVKKDIGIRNEKNKLKACEELISNVGGNIIGFAKRSQQLSMHLSKEFLSEHGYTKRDINKIASRLNSSFNHAYAVSRKEAIDMGLKIEIPSEKLEQLMWSVWKNFEEEMNCNVPFDAMSEIMNNQTIANQLNCVPIVPIPANFPPHLYQQYLNSIIQQSHVSHQSTITISSLLGCIESLDFAYHINTNLNVLAWRNFDMSIGVNVTSSSNGWRKI